MNGCPSSCNVTTHLTFESWLSFLKLERIAALSFCTTARSSAIVFAARTFRMNCFTRVSQHLSTSRRGLAYELPLRWPLGPHPGSAWEVGRMAVQADRRWNRRPVENRIRARSPSAVVLMLLVLDEYGAMLFQPRTYLPCLPASTEASPHDSCPLM